MKGFSFNILFLVFICVLSLFSVTLALPTKRALALSERDSQPHSLLGRSYIVRDTTASTSEIIQRDAVSGRAERFEYVQKKRRSVSASDIEARAPTPNGNDDLDVQARSDASVKKFRKGLGKRRI